MRQQTNADDPVGYCYDIIEFLSTAFTLASSDIIAAGTPSCVGLAMQPSETLQIGDTVKVVIHGLGQLEKKSLPNPTPL